MRRAVVHLPLIVLLAIAFLFIAGQTSARWPYPSAARSDDALLLAVSNAKSSDKPSEDVAENSAVAVDPTQASYRFEAWGTNINILTAGLYEAQNTMDPAIFTQSKRKLIDYLFDHATGIGLNGVRAFAPSGQNPEIRERYRQPDYPRPSTYWNFYEPWTTPEGAWRNDVDPIGLALLAGAKSHGANVFGLRAQGAPWWMTISKNAAGNGDRPNLDPQRYGEYTDYLAGIAKRLTDMGYPISSVSAFEEASNPPQQKKLGTSGIVNDYGPKDFVPAGGDRSPQAEIISHLRQSLNSVQMTNARVSAPNEGSPRASARALAAYPPAAFADIGVIGTHGYVARVGAGNKRLRSLADRYGMPIEVSEDDWGRKARESGTGDTWSVAIRNAQKIVSFIKDLHITRWYLWNPGPRLVWFDPAGTVKFGTQYYMLKFVVQALPAGTRIFDIGHPAAVAGITQTADGPAVRIMIVNPKGDAETDAFSLDQNPAGFHFSVRLITADTMLDPSVVDRVAVGKMMTVDLPPQSIALIMIPTEMR